MTTSKQNSDFATTFVAKSNGGAAFSKKTPLSVFFSSLKLFLNSLTLARSKHSKSNAGSSLQQKPLLKLATPLLSVAAATMLSACGGGGSCIGCGSGGGGNTPTSTVSMRLSAPNLYPAGVATNMPVVIYNNGNSSINLSNYALSIADNTTGANIVIDAASVASCATIAVNSSCTLKVTIPATSVPGSFAILASSQTDKSAWLISDVRDFFGSKSLQATTIKSTVNIGLVEVPVNTQSGVNGLTVYYPNSILASDSGDTYVVVTAMVSSANIGSFNTVKLLDSGGNALNDVTLLTGNNGSGMTNLGQNGVVSLLVKVPSGATQLQFKVQLEENGTVVDTGTTLSTIAIVSTSKKQAIAQLSPNYFTLTESAPTKILTLNNSGNGDLTNLSVSQSSQFDVVDNGCNTTLTAGSSCNFTIRYKDNYKSQPIQGAGNATLNYNIDSSMTSSSTASINYVGKNAFFGLSVVSGSNPNFDFSTTTAHPSESTLVTVKNTGNNIESDIKLTNPLPTKLSITTLGVSNPCGAMPFSLNAGESCNFTLQYSNNVESALTTSNIEFSFNYLTISGAVTTTANTLAVTYQTTQSSAVLAISPSSYAFGNILNNNAEYVESTFKVANNGDDTASNVTLPIISGTDSYHFSIKSTDCGSTLSPNDFCSITVKFGPVESSVSAGTESSTLNIGYKPYTSATATSATSNITGQVAAAGGAVLAITDVVQSGFTGGSGTLSSVYQIQESSASLPTLTYTIRNSGTVAAKNLYVSGNVTNWGLDSTTCGSSSNNTVTLAANTTCSIVYKLNEAAILSVGAVNLDVSPVSLNWVDEDSPNGQTQALSGITYANVYLAPSIAVAASESNIAPGATVTFTVSLTGGYNVGDQTISISNPDANFITLDQNSCVVSAATNSCSIIATFSSGITPPAGYNLSATTSGGVPITGSSSFMVNVSNAQAPTATILSPADGAESVVLRPTIRIHFDMPVKNVTPTNVTMFDEYNGEDVAIGSITSESNNTYSFQPASDLAIYTGYSVSIGAGVTNNSGQALASAPVQSFFTTMMTPGRVFVSAPHNADLGGVVGANAICQAAGVSKIAGSQWGALL